MLYNFLEKSRFVKINFHSDISVTTDTCNPLHDIDDNLTSMFSKKMQFSIIHSLIFFISRRWRRWRWRLQQHHDLHPVLAEG